MKEPISIFAKMKFGQTILIVLFDSVTMKQLCLTITLDRSDYGHYYQVEIADLCYKNAGGNGELVFFLYCHLEGFSGCVL